MTPFEERDEQFRLLVRREIDKTKEQAKKHGWHPSTTAWHRAFSEIAGMHKILQLIDPNANEVEVSVPERAVS